MRQLPQSILSFLWATWLLGLKQTIDIVTPGTKCKDNVLEPLTNTMVDEMDSSMKDIYRTGDNFQARIIDLMFSWVDMLGIKSR